MRRLLRWIRTAALVLAGLVAVLALAVLVASRTGLVQELIRRQVVAALTEALSGEVTIAATRGSLLRSLVFEGVRVRIEGHTVVAIPRLEAEYSLGGLVRGHLRLRRVTLVSPRVRAVRTAAGWRLPTPRQGNDDRDRRDDRDRGGSRFTLVLDRLEVQDGRVAVALLDAVPPRRFAASALTLDADAMLGQGEGRVDVRTLAAVPRGIDLGPVAVRGTLRGGAGTLAVHDLTVTTPRSRLIGEGRGERGRTVDARLYLAPLHARDVQAILPDAGIWTTTRAVIDADGPWDDVAVGLRVRFQPGGAVRAFGSVDLAASPIAYRATVRTQGLDPHAIHHDLVEADLNGHARVAGAGFTTNAPLSYALHLDASRIAGEPLARLAGRGAAADGVHHAVGRLSVAAGSVAARGRIDLNRGPRYRVGGRIDVAHLDLLVPALPGHAGLRVAVAGAGANLRLRALLEHALVRDVALDRGELRGRLDYPGLRVTRLELAGPALRASGSGQLDLDSRATEAALQADVTPGRGQLKLEASARGRYDALAVTASAALRDVQAGRMTVDRGAATADLTGVGSAAASGRLRFDATGVRVSGSDPRTVDLEGTWKHANAVDRVDLSANGRRGDEVTERLALRLDRTTERIAAELRALTLTLPESPPWGLLRPAQAEIRDGTLSTTGLTLASAEQHITVAGRVGTGHPLDAALELRSIRMGPVCVLASGPACGGTLGGRLTATGTAADPRLTAICTVVNGQVDRVAYGDVRTEVRYVGRRAALTAAIDHPEAGELQLDGTVPVDLTFAGEHPDLRNAPVDLRLHADRLDLTFLHALAPHELRQSAGRLELDVRIDGPRAAPRASGRAAVREGRIQLAAAGAPYEDLQAEAQLLGDRLEIVRFHARGGEGTVEGRGTVALTAEHALDLSVQARNFLAVRREAVEATTNGDVSVAGTLAAPDVRGKLQVTHAVVRPSSLPVGGPSLERDPTITIIGRPDAAVPPEAVSAGASSEAVRLSIDVHVPGNVWIRRLDANIELGGDLHIEKAAGGQPVVTGVIRVLRGWYAFQGRRFDIEEGMIRFTGDTPPEPLFNIEASHRAGDYRIVVRIQGSSPRPTLTLTSDPPLEQADILSVLLFGKPASELGRGESIGLQRQALQIASGYVAPQLRSSVMNTLGLDVLDVELGQGPEDPGRVTVGRYLMRDVFLTLAREFDSNIVVEVYWRRRY